MILLETYLFSSLSEYGVQVWTMVPFDGFYVAILLDRASTGEQLPKSIKNILQFANIGGAVQVFALLICVNYLMNIPVDMA